MELEVAETVLEDAPLSSREIRRAIGTKDTRTVNRALDALQRMLVLTRAGTIEHGQGWPGTAYDVLSRRYRDRLGHLPEIDAAHAKLADAVLRATGELSAADLAGALGLRRAEAAAALNRLGDEGRARRRDEGGMTLWTLAGRRAPAGRR